MTVTDADPSATPRAMAPWRSVALVVGVGLGLVAFAFAAVGIGRSFDYDEAITYLFFVNGGSLRDALTTQVIFNNHQMFSAVQAVAWQLGFVGETAQRLFPVAAGAASVGIIAGYTTRRVGAVAGATAGLVLLFNPIFIGQVRLLRGYALATLAVLIAGIALQRSWTDPRRRWLVIQGAAMVVAVTTHSYSAVTILMFAAATLAMGRSRRAHLATWAASAGLALLIQLPLLDDARRNAELRGSAYRDWFAETTLRSLVGFEWPAVIVVGSLTVVGTAAVAAQSRRHLVGVVAAGGVFVTVLLLLWQVIRPADLYPRFFISLTPVLAHLAGQGVATIAAAVPDRRVGHVAGGAAGAVAVAMLFPAALDVVRAPGPSIRDAAAVVAEAQAMGLQPCGWQAEPLGVYTDPVWLVTGIGDTDDCDLMVAVIGLNSAQRAAVEQRWDGSFTVGSIRFWADPGVIDELRPIGGG